MRTAASTRKTLQLVESGNSGIVIARHYRDGRPWRLRWDESGLREMSAAPEGAPEDLWVAPGLFDVQVNGYGGVDFQRPCTAEQMQIAAKALRRDGCHRALVALITCPWEELLAKIGQLREIVRGDAALSRAFPGWHIEGPFLSDQPGFSGAHNPLWMRDPSVDDIAQLKEVTGEDPVLMTFAPERAKSLEAISQAVRSGFVVSFGHSNASAEELRSAVGAGGRAFTHLGNGCPQKLDRHDNILWRVIDEGSMVAGLIPDTHHVSPTLFRVLHRALGAERIYWTTDAMAAAGAPSGRYSLGEIELAVGDDRVARNPVTESFAGSALEPIEGIRRGAEMLGIGWQEAWDFLSTQPARLMNLCSEIEPGSGTGFCLLREE